MPRTKPPSNKVLTIRLTEADFHHLEGYCADKGKTKTEVLVDLIRRLKRTSLAQTPVNSRF